MATAEILLARATAPKTNWETLVRDVEVFLEPLCPKEKAPVVKGKRAPAKTTDKQLATKYGPFLLRLLSHIATALADAQLKPESLVQLTSVCLLHLEKLEGNLKANPLDVEKLTFNVVHRLVEGKHFAAALPLTDWLLCALQRHRGARQAKKAGALSAHDENSQGVGTSKHSSITNVAVGEAERCLGHVEGGDGKDLVAVVFGAVLCKATCLLAANTTEAAKEAHQVLTSIGLPWAGHAQRLGMSIVYPKYCQNILRLLLRAAAILEALPDGQASFQTWQLYLQVRQDAATVAFKLPPSSPQQVLETALAAGVQFDKAASGLAEKDSGAIVAALGRHYDTAWNTVRAHIKDTPCSQYVGLLEHHGLSSMRHGQYEAARGAFKAWWRMVQGNTSSVLAVSLEAAACVYIATCGLREWLDTAPAQPADVEDGAKWLVDVLKYLSHAAKQLERGWAMAGLPETKMPINGTDGWEGVSMTGKATEAGKSALGVSLPFILRALDTARKAAAMPLSFKGPGGTKLAGCLDSVLWWGQHAFAVARMVLPQPPAVAHQVSAYTGTVQALLQGHRHDTKRAVRLAQRHAACAVLAAQSEDRPGEELRSLALVYYNAGVEHYNTKAFADAATVFAPAITLFEAWVGGDEGRRASSQIARRCAALAACLQACNMLTQARDALLRGIAHCPASDTHMTSVRPVMQTYVQVCVQLQAFSQPDTYVPLVAALPPVLQNMNCKWDTVWVGSLGEEEMRMLQQLAPSNAGAGVLFAQAQNALLAYYSQGYGAVDASSPEFPLCALAYARALLAKAQQLRLTRQQHPEHGALALALCERAVGTLEPLLAGTSTPSLPVHDQLATSHLWLGLLAGECMLAATEDTQPPLPALVRALDLWTLLVARLKEPLTWEAKRAGFWCLDSTQCNMLLLTDQLRALGHSALALCALDLYRQFVDWLANPPQQTPDNDACTARPSASTHALRLADTLCDLGQPQRALHILEAQHDQLHDRQLLRHARLLALRLEVDPSSVDDVASQLHDLMASPVFAPQEGREKQRLSLSALLALGQAKGVAATVLSLKGQPSGAVRVALEGMAIRRNCLVSLSKPRHAAHNQDCTVHRDSRYDHDQALVVRDFLASLKQLGRLYAWRGMAREADYFHRQALEVARGQHVQAGVLENFLLLAELEIDRDHTAKANTYYRDALQIAETMCTTRESLPGTLALSSDQLGAGLDDAASRADIYCQLVEAMSCAQQGDVEAALEIYREMHRRITELEGAGATSGLLGVEAENAGSALQWHVAANVAWLQFMLLQTSQDKSQAGYRLALEPLRDTLQAAADASGCTPHHRAQVLYWLGRVLMDLHDPTGRLRDARWQPARDQEAEQVAKGKGRGASKAAKRGNPQQQDPLEPAIACLMEALSLAYTITSPGLVQDICTALAQAGGIKDAPATCVYAALAHGCPARLLWRHAANMLLVLSGSGQSDPQTQPNAASDASDDCGDLVSAFAGLSVNSKQPVTATNAMFGFDSVPQYDDLAKVVDSLPPHWTVATVTYDPATACLILTRHRPHTPPLPVRVKMAPLHEVEGQLPGPVPAEIAMEQPTVYDYAMLTLNTIMTGMRQTLLETAQVASDADKRQWWQRRQALDSQLAALMAVIETHWLGTWRGMLRGLCKQSEGREAVADAAVQLVDTVAAIVGKVHVQAYGLPDRHYAELLLDAGDMALTDSALAMWLGPGLPPQKLAKVCAAVREAGHSLREELDGGREHVLLLVDRCLLHVPWEAMPVLRDQPTVRIASMASLVGVGDTGHSVVDGRSVFYVLNPDKDLDSTENTFKPVVARQETWKGVAGRAPAEEELMKELQQNDMFLYCGHGGAEKFIHGDKLAKLPQCATALLLGCSSARLRVEGVYGPTGTPINYLVANSPAVVGMLWDVTDKDLDRFGQALLDNWLPGTLSLAEAVCRARSVCRLPQLTGAAPVVYGLPVWCAPQQTAATAYKPNQRKTQQRRAKR